MTEKNIPNQPVNPAANTNRKPNDTGSISVEGFIKIFDPKTNEVIVEKRA